MAVRRVADGLAPWPRFGAARQSTAEIRRLFGLLDAELSAAGVTGELHVIGGAVMCVAFGPREATRNADAIFRPERAVRDAAARVATAEGAPSDWLNDAAKGLIGAQGAFDAYLELPNLRVFVAEPTYMLAMKCVAMRQDVGARDTADVRFLLSYLGIGSVDEALAVVSRYFKDERVLPKARLALAQILGG